MASPSLKRSSCAPLPSEDRRTIHPTAIVDPQARVDPTAELGPYTIVGPEVEIGARTRVLANVYLDGPLTIGEDNLFYPYSTIGVASQDKKYQGERAYTRIGHRNTIRECVTINRGTAGGGALTSIGDDNLLMAYTHVAHDVHIGHGTIIANGVTFAGHVTVEDFANIGAFTGIHQFCRIGRNSMIGGYSVILQDVLPFSITSAERVTKTYGENKIGLERRGFTPEQIAALHKAFRWLRDKKLNTTQAVEKIRAELPPDPSIEQLLAFIQTSERGFIK